jgi:hypothetical protein
VRSAGLLPERRRQTEIIPDFCLSHSETSFRFVKIGSTASDTEDNSALWLAEQMQLQSPRSFTNLADDEDYNYLANRVNASSLGGADLSSYIRPASVHGRK